ncbi:DUF481 domain-containing protein [Reichenbachiella sp.]|uniref:DUF481 domain-containing protein n=1 Tax=Reichenbachiella sp. TaxID=2184521 RepID=UPI003BAF1083
MRFVFSLIGFIALLSVETAQAQILNINTRDVTSDSSNYWLGWFDFYFEVDNRSPTPDEDASLLSLEATLDLIYVSKSHAYYLSGDISHYEATGDPVISTGYAHVRIDLNRKKRLSTELYTQFNFDHSRHLQLRYLSGGGLKYRLVDREEIEFDIGTGFFYEHEKWKDLVIEDFYVTNNMIKSSSYFKSNIELTDHVNLAYITFYQVGYDENIEALRNRISAQIQLEFEFSKHFMFMIEGIIHYEDKPIIPINKTIYGIKNGLRYKF